MNEYQIVAADLRKRARALLDAADTVEAAAQDAQKPRATLKPAKRLKATGTHALVLQAIRSGHGKLADIAKDAKLKESTARTAVLALEAGGHVRREGKGPLTRYVAAMRKVA
jgi:DNA-binding MarR family transcriptional regulator